MFIATVLLLTALLYSVAERHTREGFSYKRNGAIRFYRIGRLSGSFCYSKKAR